MAVTALARPTVSKAQIITATTLGTALEFYDFTVYSYFAITIGKLFFPAETPVNQMLLSIGVFGVGFVVRPLGGVIIGAYADRAGRKKAMVLTILLMALGCALISFVPPFAVIGVAAPVIVLLARLVQGFAAGGEFGPGTTLLIECAGDRDRAFFASWNFAAQALGLALGASAATLLSWALPKEALDTWGWRIPFAVGILAAPAGMLIRRRLEETLDARTARASAKSGAVRAVLTTHIALTILGTFAELGGSVSVYVTAFFLPSYATRELGLSAATGVSSGVVGAIALFVSAPLMGLAADRFTRKRVLVTCRVAMLVLVYPAFLWLTRQPTPFALYAVSAGLAVLVSGQIVPVLVMLPEIFPKAVRATGIALTYVVSASIFGGFSPFIATWLVAETGDKLAPALYVAAACLLSLVPIRWLTDHTGQRLA
ncbi:MFS transporter [Aliidongia dinghuensis]|uniref:MFS transporter n=1 Tax=Aliidongia dinghuensis TaxID=1867774 RepID=A0A8J2YR77_9PROT|nr:MFS transporter [Aliidongia dinghuensis]GGF05166.1 MFS transporter [Aliidongia dinghuensis]